MVLGLLTLAAIPTTIGVAEGVSQQRKQNEEDDDATRMAKFNIDVFCDARTRRAKKVDGGRIVLRDEKVWIASPHPQNKKDRKEAYTAQAFYIEYPDEEREKTRGLVTRVSDDPPMLNWMYVDKNTLELKYGNRTQSREHHVGPWDWTEDEGGVTFEGWEGFVAVEVNEGEWAVYFDRRDNGLEGVVDRRKRRMVEVSLERVMCEGE
ncbi:MAG: hypothetical protein Q9160_002712 [Pyrenula sp. 1 TL-2023]